MTHPRPCPLITEIFLQGIAIRAIAAPLYDTITFINASKIETDLQSFTLIGPYLTLGMTYPRPSMPKTWGKCKELLS